MHSLEICALLDVRGGFFLVFFFYYFAASMPTSLAEPAPVGACQDLAGFIDALWWCSTITVEMAAPARVVPERKVHLWTMACFHRRASPQNAADEGGDFGKMALASLTANACRELRHI